MPDENELRVARNLALPLALVGESVAILAKRNAGKTYAASVIEEELISHGQQVVVLDPVGVHYGLRSNAKGTGAGLPVVVLGGEHGDLPINGDSGTIIADLVIDAWPQSFVIDTSLFDSNAEQDRFAEAFGERLYRRKARDKRPMMLVLEEADTVAPQSPMPDQRRMVGAYTTIARRGRSRGIGYLAITQRAAALHKDLTTQAELVVVMQIIGSQDRDAIDKWVKSNATAEEREEVMSSLPSLQQGEAWVWSPGWLRLRQRIKFRTRRTFDASRTPAPGEQRAEPTGRAEVNLDAVRVQIEAATKEAKANDPKALRERVRELERMLSPQNAPEDAQYELVYPFSDEELDNAIADAEQAMARNGSAREAVAQTIATLEGMCSELREDQPRLNRLHTVLKSWRESKEDTIASLDVLLVKAAGNRVAGGMSRRVARKGGSAPVAAAAAQNGQQRPQTGQDDSTLKKAERTILGVLAQFPDGRSVKQLALLTGYSATSGGFRNALGKLRTAEYISRDHPVRITEAGVEAIGGQFEPMPTGDALFDYWLRKLKRAEREILNTVRYDAMSTERAAELTGYSPTSGGFRNALGKLRTLDLIEKGQPITLTAEFASAVCNEL
jgi:hypothetical protein